MTELVENGRWMMLPPDPALCQICAVDHPPEAPHDPQSLYYQTSFHGAHGRRATWGDAWAHCTPAIIDLWNRLVNQRLAAAGRPLIDREGQPVMTIGFAAAEALCLERDLWREVAGMWAERWDRLPVETQLLHSAGEPDDRRLGALYARLGMIGALDATD